MASTLIKYAANHKVSSIPCQFRVLFMFWLMMIFHSIAARCAICHLRVVQKSNLSIKSERRSKKRIVKNSICCFSKNAKQKRNPRLTCHSYITTRVVVGRSKKKSSSHKKRCKCFGSFFVVALYIYLLTCSFGPVFLFLLLLLSVSQYLQKLLVKM